MAAGEGRVVAVGLCLMRDTLHISCDAPLQSMWAQYEFSGANIAMAVVFGLWVFIRAL